MRKTVAKRLRKEVAHKMYPLKEGEKYTPSEKKRIYANRQIKSMVRKRKKVYNSTGD